jgi:hypothetical protein
VVEFQPELPLGEPRQSNLRPIEGGRAIQARNVRASFAVDCDEIESTAENMAGYAVVAWDDEGGMTFVYHAGVRNPFSPAMIPDLVRNRVAAEILGGAA